MDIPEEKLTRWKTKRRRTFAGYLIVGVIIGMDFVFMFNTLYPYLKDMIKTERPRLFYGVIIATYNFASTISGVFVGRWVDKTRKVKCYTIMIILLQIVGSFIYAIPYSPYFPLIGRLLCGLGDPFASVVSGEVVRIYDNEESTRALWWIASVYGIGQTISPMFVYILADVEFHIFSIHVTRLNVVPLLIASMFIVSLFVVIFLVHDCSAEIDLKEYLHDKNSQQSLLLNEESIPLMPTAENEITNKVYEELMDEKDYQPLKRRNFYTPPIWLILKALLSNMDTCLMLVSTLLFVYNVFSSEVLLPLLTLNILQFSLNTLSIIMVIYGITMLFFYIIMAKHCTGDRAIYSMALVSILMQIFLFVMMIFIKYTSRDRTRDLIVLCLYVVCCSVSWFIEEVLIRCMLAKMVPSNCQSFTETIRNGCSRITSVIAAVTAPLVIPFLQWWSLVMLVFTFIFLICYVVRRNHLCNIKQIDIVDD